MRGPNTELMLRASAPSPAGVEVAWAPAFDQLRTLKFRSILGNYRVDSTGMQTAKSTYLLQCQEDHISLVYPPDVSRYKVLYPYPG